MRWVDDKDVGALLRALTLGSQVYVDLKARACTCPERPAATLTDNFNNDPSAGSPTETLLRLLLPLNDQV
jgi:hypothetical protein